MLSVKDLTLENTLELTEYNKITGIFIKKSGGNVTVSTIDENDMEECISTNNKGESILELDVKTFVAGAPICGKKLKRLKLVCDCNTKVDLVKIYGIKND